MPQCIPPDKLKDLVDKEPYTSDYERDIAETKERNMVESRNLSKLDSLANVGYLMMIFGVFIWMPFWIGFRSLTVNVIYWLCWISLTAFVVYGFSKRSIV